MRRVDVGADDAVAEVGEAGARGEAHVAGSDDDDVSAHVYPIGPEAWLDSLRGLRHVKGSDMSSDDVGRQAHQAFAKECNNATYRLLDKAARSPEETETMIDMAHARDITGLRVAAPLRTRFEPTTCAVVCTRSPDDRSPHSTTHARRCRRPKQSASTTSICAYVHEAMARALACAGEVEAAGTELATAMAVPIADPEDKEVFDADVAMEPWYGVNQD